MMILAKLKTTLSILKNSRFIARYCV